MAAPKMELNQLNVNVLFLIMCMYINVRENIILPRSITKADY